MQSSWGTTSISSAWGGGCEWVTRVAAKQSRFHVQDKGVRRQLLSRS